MERKYKVALGVGAIAVTLYLLLSKKAKGEGVCTKDYCNYTIPKGTIFRDAKVHGTGGIAIKVNPMSKYDSGYRVLPKESYTIIRVIQNEKPSYAPYIQPMKIDNKELYVDAKVDIMTTRDIVESYQNKSVIYT